MDERTGPLTWGQYLPWVTHHAAPESNTYFKINTFDIIEPAGISVDTVLDVLDQIVAKHEGLRTTFDRVPGAHRQIVHPMRERGYRYAVYDDAEPTDSVPTGSAPTGSAPTDAAPSAETLGWLTEPFDLAGEWPVRAALWRRLDGGWNLRLAVHRLILDREGMLVFRGYFARGVRTGAIEASEDRSDPAAWDPVDIAEFELSTAGQRRDERAYTYWRKALMYAPASLFITSRPPRPTDSRFIISMGRAGMRPMVRDVAASFRVTEPAVMLAIGLLVLSWVGRWPVVCATIVANNRSLRELRRSMSPMLDRSLLSAAADPTQPFSAWVRAIGAASIGACKHSHADPNTLLRANADVSMERGVLLDRLPIINVIADPPPAGQESGSSPVLVPDHYEVKVVPSPLDGVHVRVRLWWDRVSVELFGGEQMFEQATAERLVHLFPAVLEVLTANGDVALGKLADIALEAVPEMGEASSRTGPAATVEIDHTRVDLAAVETLLRECAGVTDCAVATGTGEDGALQLTAHVAGDERVHDLHVLRLAVLGRLPHHRHVMCPHRFRVVREAPKQSDSEPAWAALPSVAEGSGWPAPPVLANGDAEVELAAAVAAAHPPRGAESVDMGRPYCLAGGRLEHVPDVLDGLAERGIEGISVDDLMGTEPLANLLPPT